MVSNTVEIISLSKDDLSELIRQTAQAVVLDLRDDFSKPTPELMTKAELAGYLRCNISKIDRLMKVDLPYIIFGAQPRFRKSAIDEWLNGGLAE
jgi:hypothetical protein